MHFRALQIPSSILVRNRYREQWSAVSWAQWKALPRLADDSLKYRTYGDRPEIDFLPVSFFAIFADFFILLKHNLRNLSYVQLQKIPSFL